MDEILSSKSVSSMLTVLAYIRISQNTLAQSLRLKHKFTNNPTPPLIKFKCSYFHVTNEKNYMYTV